MSVTRAEVTELFNRMTHEGFKAEKAEGVDATIQFDLSGENGGMWWLRIVDKQVTLNEGTVTNPNMTVRASADDYAAMLNGTMNPMQAFMTGKVKVQGDMQLAMKFMAMFG